MAELDQAAELATGAVEEAVAVVRNHVTWMWGGWFVGACMGAGGGYFAARYKLEAKYEKLAETEIDQMREHFQKRMVVRETKPDLSDLNERVGNLGYRGEGGPSPSPPVPSPPVPVVPPPDIVIEVSPPEDEGWDWDHEKHLRELGARIYVLHKDEFGETDNQETSLTYYEGDDVLCDDHDRPIDDQHKLVGDCLDKFGHGSGDRIVVFVRNEDLDLDMEVIKSSKTYAEEVHGFTHEDTPRRRKQTYQE